MKWPEIPIEDVCEVCIDCVNRTAPTVSYPTPYKMIRTSNVKDGFVDLTQVRYVNEATYRKWTRRSVPRRGDVVLTREAPLGSVGRITTDENVFLGQRIFHYRADNDKVDPDFLAYVLQSPVMQGRIRSKGFGATVEHMQVGECMRLLIPVPSREVQRRIGSILAAYDDLIENNRSRIGLLEESAQQLFTEWFVRLRFPDYDNASCIDRIPKDWIKRVVPELFDINPKTIAERDVEKTYVPMASLTESTSLIMETEVRTRTSGTKFKNGDTLLARITPCIENGKTALVQCLNDDEVAIGSTEFIVFRPRTVGPAWTYSFARSKHLRQTAINSMKGSDGRQRVNPAVFSDYPVLLPPKSLLSKFEDIAGRSLQLVQNLHSQNLQLIQARTMLLPRLMSGELEV
ncbi:MAG: restriction endonuclease subunit S [Rubripirellula sp.]